MPGFTRKLFVPWFLVGALLALILRVFARRASAKRVTDGAGYDAIDIYVAREMQRLHMPGVALAIVDGDKIVHWRGFGRARPDGAAPTLQTPFYIGSLTKSFTALAVMQLVEAGKMELNAPVQRYLPWFRLADPQASARMTVRHLLNQTSGLPTAAGELPLADFDSRADATERQARALATLELARPVGSAFEYSNANYNLLGLVIEAAGGEPYAGYVQTHILTPLGMCHTYTSRAMAQQNGLAMGHQYWFGIPFAAPNVPVPHGSLPAGLLISSAEDLSRYLIAFLNGGRYDEGQIVSRAGVDELQRGVADIHVMGLALGQYTMGWFVDKIGQAKLAWHGGTLPDFAAFMALLPEQKQGVVLLFNADHHWMNPVLADFGIGVADLLAGARPKPVPFVRMIPWMLRGQLLIPALQIGGVAATLRLLRRWRQDPECRPRGGRAWGLQILLPLTANLLLALSLMPMLGKRRGYLVLYMPDSAWIARVCGSFALGWGLLRTRLVIQCLRKDSDKEGSNR